MKTDSKRKNIKVSSNIPNCSGEHDLKKHDEKNISLDVKKATKIDLCKLEEDISINSLIDLYWSYFQLHSKQRMKILDMFIKIQLALYAAYYAIGNNLFNLKYMCAVAISLVALLCYLLDKRTTNLIHMVRVAFRKIERKYMVTYPKEMKLFKKIKNTEGVVNYSRIIRFAYLLSFFVGIVLLFHAIHLHLPKDIDKNTETINNAFLSFIFR